WKAREHARAQGRRAAHEGGRDRRRDAAEGRVVAARAGGRRRQGAHHRRPAAPRDPPRAVHARRHRDGDRTVKDDKVDTKTLLEWSAKYHTPNYGRTPILTVRCEGTRVRDSDGREYVGFTTGTAVAALGHCHPVVLGAIPAAAAARLPVAALLDGA